MAEVQTPKRIAIPASEFLSSGPGYNQESIPLQLLESSRGAEFQERLT